MQSTELLHRFFDEGLDDSLEDVLFERMAVDAELRREFLQHQKMQHMIQEDVAGITTPSHVSQQLFIHLGLTPPDNIPPPPGLGRRIGAAMAGFGGALVRGRRYVFTAAISALATAILVMGLFRDGEPLSSAVSDLTRTNEFPQVTPQQDTEAKDGVRDNSGTAVPSSLPSSASAVTRGAPPAPTDAPRTSASARSSASARTSASARSSAAQAAAAYAGGSLASGTPFAPLSSAADRGTAQHTALMRRSGIPAMRTLADVSRAQETDGDDALRAMVARATPIPLAEASGERPWHFFQPGPRTNLLSNLVFELRKQYGQSYPSVDLPHNSHTLFENMAISAVYKVTEHHAFGFEYGRENFGREFITAGTPAFAPLDPSMQELYTPPSPAMAETVRENRMLDVFGAVWKLSMPEYGMFRFVYPYMRTFVGASLVGPISKVRVGLEMYPSNFSMLNVGLEGGLLRYSVDEATYYTSKLNFTVGVAIGF
jgi:hypothetical protein